MIRLFCKMMVGLTINAASLAAYADEPINCDPTQTKFRFVIFENSSIEFLARSGYSTLAFEPEFPQEAFEQPQVPVGANGQPLISSIRVTMRGRDCMASAEAVSYRRGDVWSKLRPGRFNEFHPHYFGERFTAEEIRVTTKLRLVESTECQVKVEALIQHDVPPFLTPTSPRDPRC